jgi:putative spermidine/putrescine transport system substrate-binding protein
MKVVAAIIADFLLIAACAFAQTTPTTLIAAAQKEGRLTIIADPRDWVNYGELIAGFTAKYHIEIDEQNPRGSSVEELEAIRTNKDNTDSHAPDVIDVDLKYGPEAKAGGLITPYKVATWASIPDSVKDKDGYWYGGYYGTLVFEVNSDMVKNPPKDWPDLLKPEFRGKIALTGDPRIAKDEAFYARGYMTVVAASLANGAKAPDDVEPGLRFFASMNKAGNLLHLIANSGTLASGQTPIVIDWDYNALANRDRLEDNPKVQVLVPTTGVVAGVFVQAISAYAPHPNAAKLWMEYLYSDEGQLLWLKGYGRPVRFVDLAERRTIPADYAARLPPAASYARVVFPTIEQQAAASRAIADGWDGIVGADIQKR